MRFLLRNLTSCSINKLTSLKFQVQLPINNVHAIMHGLHDLTGNDDKSLKGESFVCFNCRKINTMKQITLYFDLLLRGSPSLFSFILFGCFFFFFFLFFFWNAQHYNYDRCPLHDPHWPTQIIFYPHSPTSNPLTHSSVFDSYYTLIYTSRKGIKHWH